MDNIAKVKQWVNENIPMLSNVYENKYVGMLSDRFASLPTKQQKQVLIGTGLGIGFIVSLFLFLAYLSLWSTSSQVKETNAMTNMLLQYQKARRDKSDQVKLLARNAPLSNSGQLKQFLTDLGKTASISPRMIKVEEKGEVGAREEDSKSPQSEVKIKQATATLEKITLSQLTNYLKGIEFGQYNLQISSVKILNDDKIRGYMKVEVGVVAHLFETEES